MLCMQSAILFNHFRLSVRLSNAGVSKRMQISHFLMVWKVVSFYFYGLLPLQNSSENPVSGSSAECVRRIMPRLPVSRMTLLMYVDNTILVYMHAKIVLTPCIIKI